MDRSTPSRLTAVTLSAALLASMSIALAAAPAFALDCTYTFPDDGGKYPGEAVVAGEIICGGPGDDYVPMMEGGRFYGRGGNDAVGTMNGGRFFGNEGADTVEALRGGTFFGGLGNDQVIDLGDGKFLDPRLPALLEPVVRAVFRGGPGDDTADTVAAGATFYGGSGRDSVQYLRGLFRGGPDPDDVFRMDTGSRFFGARGNDAVDRDGGTFDSGAMFGASHFNGGLGNDFADICGDEATLVSVERTSDDCPGPGE